MKTERSNAPLVAGTLLIAFGLLSLASQLFRNIIHWSYVWPLAVIILGGLFFAGMFLGGRQVSGLAIPGTIITGIGLMLLYQNLTSQWETWSYAWTLIVLFVGLGIYLAGLYARNEAEQRSGIGVMKVGFILFVIFGAFFEMILSADRNLGLRGLLFPSLLVLLGAYILVRRLGLLGGESKPVDRPETPEPPSVTQ